MNAENNNIKKERALSLLNSNGIVFNSREDLDMALLGLTDILMSQEKEVPPEIASPQDYDYIPRDYLVMLRDQVKETLGRNLLSGNTEENGQNQAQLLPSHETNGQQNGGAIVEDQSQGLSEHAQAARERAIAGFREILNELGTKYVAQAVGISLSDNFWLEVDKAKAQRDEHNLKERVDGLREDFHEAKAAIDKAAQEKTTWQQETLGKFSTLADFSDLDADLAAIKSR